MYLAGEIARPGTFSLKTVSVLRDLDRDIAKTFETATKLMLSDNLLPEYGRAKKLYEGLGLNYQDMLDLLDSGLLLDTGPVVFRLMRDANGWWSLGHHDYRFRICNNNLSRRGTPADLNEIKLPVLPLTKAGVELAALPAWQPDLAIMRELAQYIRQELAERGKSVKITWTDGDGEIEHEFDPPVTSAE